MRLQLKIHSSNLPEAKTEVIVNHINEGMDKFTIEKVSIYCYCFYLDAARYLLIGVPIQDIATYVKKKCDEVLSGTWHCVVGRNFGCSITHDTKFVLFLQVDQMHVLIFKSLE